MLVTRGNKERGGEETGRLEKGWVGGPLIPASKFCPWRASDRGGSPRWGSSKVSPGSGSGADAALAATLVEVTLVTIQRGRDSYCACLDSILVYKLVCTIVRQVLCVNTIKSRSKKTTFTE